jgi:hypothetical protein
VRSMFLFIAFGMLLFSGQNSDTGSSRHDDPYSTEFVDSAFRFFKRALKEGSFGGEAKNFTHMSPSLPQLADRVSIAAMKIYPPTELIKSDNATAYLSIVRTAFSDKSKVLEVADKNPRVTLFVLEYLREKENSNPDLERRIDYLERCVPDFTCSPQSEAAFFRDHSSR